MEIIWPAAPPTIWSMTIAVAFRPSFLAATWRDEARRHTAAQCNTVGGTAHAAAAVPAWIAQVPRRQAGQRP